MTRSCNGVLVLVLAEVLLAGACLDAKVTPCDGIDLVCPDGKACDATHKLCVLPSQLSDCAGMADGAPCAVDGTVAVCRDEVCLLQYCGDGIKNAGEQCDGDDLGDESCLDHGFYQHDGLACSASCTFDTSACRLTCGDGTVNGDEACDGAPPADNACVTFGFDAGVVGCSDLCVPATATCKTIGWRRESGAGYVYAVWAAAPDDIYAGGTTLVHFDGTAWTETATGLTSSVGAIWGRDGTDVYAAGTTGELAHRVNGTWSVQKLGNYLADIHGAGADVYAAGTDTGNALAVFHASGSGAWAPLPGFAAIAAGYPRAIRALGASDVYVADGTGVLHWDGAQWTRSLAAGSAVGRLFSVGSDVYAVGAGIFHHDASGWKRMTFPYNQASAITGSAPDDLYAIGSSLFHYDGTAWLPLATDANVGTGIALVSPGNLVAGGQGIWRYTGNDRTDLHASGRANLRAVYANSATSVQAVGDAGVAVRLVGDRWRVDPTPTTSMLLALWNGFAVGLDGTILQWTGTTWVAMTSPTTSTLRSVWGASPTNVYAVGDASTALHFDGANWTTFPAPIVNGAPLDLVAVWGTSAADVYLVGNDHAVGGGYVVHGTGTTFGTPTFVTPDLLNDAWAYGAGPLWLAGTNGGVFRGSGTTFTQIPSGTVEDLATIRGASATDIRITMTHGQYDPSDQYIAWNGTKFSEKLYFCEDPAHERMAIAGVAAVGANAYIAVGPQLEALRDTGGQCTLELGGDFAQGATLPISDAPDSVYWIATVFFGRAQLMHFDGSLVSGVATGLTETNLVWASSATDVFAIDRSGDVAHFDGNSWTVTSNALGGMIPHAITGSGPHDVWVFGEQGMARHFDGTSWTASVLPNATYGIAWTVSPSLAFAVDADAGLIQCWMGSTWSDCPGSHVLANGDTIHAMWGSGPTDVYAVGPVGYVLHWNGASWSDEPVAAALGFLGIAGSGPNDVFGIDADGSMVRFDGATWSPVRGPAIGAGFSGATYTNHVVWTAVDSPPGILGLSRASAW